MSNNDIFDEVRDCPICGNKTTYGEMIWLNGKCTCPACYIKRRAAEDAKKDWSDET